MIDSRFENELTAACKKNPGRIIFAEGDDRRTQQAAIYLANQGAFDEIGLCTSDRKTLEKTLEKEIDLKSSRIRLLNCSDSSLIQSTSEHCLTLLLAKGKKPKPETLQDISKNPLYQAGTLLASGQFDCAVAGAVSTTADVIRASLATVGLAKDCRTVSGSFFMIKQGPTNAQDVRFIFADCGVVIEPSKEQLVDIAWASCELWSKIVNTPPVVAFLSFSTKGSASHVLQEKIANAWLAFKKLHPDIESDGELQFDSAFDKDTGSRKAPKSQVPGRANVFIFPDLNSGNIAYKVAQRLGGFNAYGPILQGLAKPYSDLSRGASAQDIAVAAMISRLRRLE